MITRLARWGIGGRHMYILTVRGRTSGRPHSTPVRLIEGGERWLVAPYGDVGWVRNARAAGSVELRHGRSSEILSIEEVAPEVAAPVLREYLKKVAVVRPFFDVKTGSPLEAFVVEAPRHPVFRLTAAASR